MLAMERRDKILKILAEEKHVKVPDLARAFQVTEETIRRDLEKLEKDGFCIKSYGGAMLKEDLSFDLPFHVRQNKNVMGKGQMGALVASLISEEESLFLDASTTAVFVARALKSFNKLTVITNSVEILMELFDRSGWTVVGTGGEVMYGYRAMLGTRAEEVLRSYYVDTAIISCKCLAMDRGMCESRYDLLAPKKAMISCSKRRILVADASKFDKTSLAVNPCFQDIDCLVSDKEPSKEWMEFLSQRDIQVLYPERT